MPAVISGSGSVFATAAAARLAGAARGARAALAPLPRPRGRADPAARLERDAARAGQRIRARAAAPAPARLGADLREHGVSTLAEAILDGERTAGRLLSQIGGERQLTDLQHVGQLLNAAAGSEQFGLAALTGWLRQRIVAADREGSNDERTRRLDSDADAVQVLTFHRSKGLEFPVVYCPFLWEAGRLADEGSPVYFHDDDGERAIDVGLDGRGVRRAPAPAQRRGARRGAAPRLRGAHPRPPPGGGLVGQRLVRARLAARAAAVRTGARGRRRLARRSGARARTMRRATLRADPASWRRTRSRSSRRGSDDPRPGNRTASTDAELDRARFRRRFDSAWRRTSYSALTAAAHDALVASEPEEAGVTDEPEAACGDRAPSRAAAVGDGQRAAARHADPRGPAAGRLRAPLTSRASCAVAGRAAVAQPPRAARLPAGAGGAGLALALATPLGGELSDSRSPACARRDRLDELGFELPLAGGDQPRAARAARPTSARC